MRRPSLVVLVLALALAGCSGQQLLNTLVPDDGYRLTADRAYGDKPRQRLDVYVPRDVAGPAPVVVFFYGGRWSDGSKAGYQFAAQALTSKGYVVVVPDYRLYPQVRFPTFVEDGAQAVAWTFANIAEYGGDANKLFIMGHSAGAHIAAMLALDGQYLQAVGLAPKRLRGLIGLAGPYDFLPLESADLKDMFGPPERYPASQPINFVSTCQPPLLLIHGKDDHTVDPANTRNLARASRELGAQAVTHFYPDVGHVGLAASLGYPLRGQSSALADTDAFIQRILARSAPTTCRAETP